MISKTRWISVAWFLASLALALSAGCFLTMPANLPPSPPAPTSSISADSGAIQQGQSVTLSWTTHNATDVSIEGLGAVPPTGTQTITPRESTHYRLLAKGPGGSAEAMIMVTVVAPPSPPPPEQGKPPPDIFWNTWAEDRNGPRFVPAFPLKPGTSYRLSLDLAALRYRAPGTVAVGVGQEFKKEVEKWLQPGMPPPVLKVLLLPDPGMFDARPAAKDFAVDLDRLRAVWKRGAVDVPDDAFRILKDAYPQSPDFVLGETVFEVKTGNQEGPAAAAFSIWHQDRPIDEVSVQFCIAGTPEAAKAKCGDMANPVAPQGLATVRAASRSAVFPSAAIHFVSLGEQSRVTGVFRESAWEKDRFLVWQLDQDAARFRQTISDGFLKDIASGFTDDNLLQRGESLFLYLFPKESVSFDGTKIHDHIRGFLEPYFQRDPSAKDYVPPSIFVRMSQVGPSPSLPIPLGLMAVRRNDAKDMTLENGRFLGDYFRIESPLEVQAYTSSEQCLSRWVMVVPPEIKEDDAITRALGQLGETVKHWRTEEVLPFDRMTAFKEWLYRSPVAGGEDPPTTLVTLSHHNANSLYFYDPKSDKDNPLRHSMINRRFAQPSVAILDGCGTGGASAEELIRRLNQRGFSTIVAASAEIGGTMAGAFLKALAEEISAVSLEDPAKGETIGIVYWKALRRLSAAMPVGVPSTKRFGAGAHLFALLGNGDVTLCAPRKEDRPLPDQ